MTIAETLTLAWQHQQAGNLDQAEALYRQVLDADPQNANACYRLAVVCQLQGRTAEAIPLYQQLLRSRPDSALVHYNLGLASVAEGRLADAIASYREALRLRPDSAEIYNSLGVAHTMRCEWEEALAAHRRALELNPRYATAWSNLGWCHMLQYQTDEAIRCYRQALALELDHAVALHNLGNALLFQGKVAEAADCYRHALRVRPDHVDAACGLADVYCLSQQWDEAVACLQSSLARRPSERRTHEALGDIFYQLGKDAEALGCFQQMLALRPGDAKARLMVQTLTSGERLTRIPADYLAAEYNPVADRFDQRTRWRGDRSPALLQAAVARLSESGGEQHPTQRVGLRAPGLAILDLGCGTGLCGVLFRAWAHTLIGVDVSPNMLARASARGLYDELIQNDLLATVQAYQDRFDLILASDVLLYFGDLAPLFAAVRRALRPGGRFAFTLDLLEGPEDYRLTPWMHFAHSRAYLQELADKNQMQEVAQEQVYFPRENGYHGAGLVVVMGCA